MLRKRGYDPNDADFSAVAEIASLIEFETPELDNEDEAINAFRDMFTSKQYSGVVPDEDIKKILSSGQRWFKVFGKPAVLKAWKTLKQEKYVELKSGEWRWLG